MDSISWNSVIVKNRKDLGQYHWALAYFHYHDRYGNWDGHSYIMNLQELRIRDLTMFTMGDVSNKKVLEVGCGNGEYMLTLSKLGAISYGQDLSKESVALANQQLKSHNFGGEAKQGCATQLLFEDNAFDIVYSCDFFEHITHEQKIKVLKESYRVLKPGGLLLIKTPNLTYLKLTNFLRRIKTIMRGKNPFNVHIPHTRNNPDTEHCGLPTYKELEDLLETTMFHIPNIIFVPVIRNNMPHFLTKFFYGKKMFTETIVMTSRKPLFYGMYGDNLGIKT